MVIDGKVINLVNFWKHDDINAGDDLIMYVEDRPYTEYVLSHHPKCMKKQVFPMMATWELPACLAEYGKEGHISNDGEDLVKRIWDLLCELSSTMRINDAHQLVVPNHVMKTATTLTSDKNKELWQDSDAMRASGPWSQSNQHSGMHGNTKHAITGNSIVDLLPDEAMYEMKCLLFDTVDSDAIVNFIMDVKEFSTEYRVKVCVLRWSHNYFYYAIPDDNLKWRDIIFFITLHCCHL
jgi:hypothetical protein